MKSKRKIMNIVLTQPLFPLRFTWQELYNEKKDYQTCDLLSFAITSVAWMKRKIILELYEKLNPQNNLNH